jgi:hypothetical protein
MVYNYNVDFLIFFKNHFVKIYDNLKILHLRQPFAVGHLGAFTAHPLLRGLEGHLIPHPREKSAHLQVRDSPASLLSPLMPSLSAHLISSRWHQTSSVDSTHTTSQTI